MTNPTYISNGAELADAMQPTAKDAADWAAAYKRYQNPAVYVLDDGEQVTPKGVKKELEALNVALKRYVELNGPLTVEGVGTLDVQRPQSEKVDVISLHQHDAETFFRLLQLGCLSVDMAALKAQEKAGMIAANVPRMPVASTSRLVWVKDG